MSREFGTEIDSLKQDLEEIKALLKAPQRKYPAIRERGEMPEEGNIEIERLKEYARETGNERGIVSYMGFHYSSGRESNWGASYITVNELISMPSDKVSVVLSALGNEQRLAILLALLEQPMTVTKLVEKLGMKTSGQAYHHLNSLLAADLLEEVKDAEKGTYAVKGHRVQGLIMVLAGVNDLIDTTYSTGTWETSL